MVSVSLLEKIGILSGLKDDELEDFGRSLAPLCLEKGSYLFYRNDISTGLYLVYEGDLQVIIDNDANREIIVYTVNPGDIVGEMALFDEPKRSATVVALDKCRLFKIRNRKFIEMMRAYPQLAINFSRILINRLHEADAMIESLGTMDGTERVLSHLTALALREGHRKDEWYELAKKPTYRQISQRLGISEKTVYRTMSALVNSGDIKPNGQTLMMRRELVEDLN